MDGYSAASSFTEAGRALVGPGLIESKKIPAFLPIKKLVPGLDYLLRRGLVYYAPKL